MQTLPAFFGLNPRASFSEYMPVDSVPTLVPKASSALVTAFSVARWACAWPVAASSTASVASALAPMLVLIDPPMLHCPKQADDQSASHKANQAH